MVSTGPVGRPAPTRPGSLLPSPARSSSRQPTGCVRCPACPLLNPVAPPATHHSPQGPGKWAAYLVARHDLAIHALDPLELSDEVPEFALRAHLWTRRPDVSECAGDRRSARAFSPRRAACQTTALSFRKPGIPVHPRPGQSPGWQRRQLPRSAEMRGLRKRGAGRGPRPPRTPSSERS